MTNQTAALDNDLKLWFSVRVDALVDRLRMRRHLVRMRGALAEVETCVLFIGYPRSGHSIVGSLIDAHPDAMIAHRMDAVRLLRAGEARERVHCLMVRNAERFAASDRTLTGYGYAVPGQWQGRYRRLRVVGDQEGNWTSRRLGTDLDFTRRLTSGAEPVRYRLLHVIRNPFDNITTWARRSATSLDASIDRYFRLCEHVRAVRSAIEPGVMLDVRHEDFVAAPAEGLRMVLDFVGLEAEPKFVDAASSIVYASPNRSRHAFDWSRGQRDLVLRRAAGFDYLHGYDWEN